MGSKLSLKKALIVGVFIVGLAISCSEAPATPTVDVVPVQNFLESLPDNPMPAVRAPSIEDKACDPTDQEEWVHLKGTLVYASVAGAINGSICGPDLCVDLIVREGRARSKGGGDLGESDRLSLSSLVESTPENGYWWEGTNPFATDFEELVLYDSVDFEEVLESGTAVTLMGIRKYYIGRCRIEMWSVRRDTS